MLSRVIPTSSPTRASKSSVALHMVDMWVVLSAMLKKGVLHQTEKHNLKSYLESMVCLRHWVGGSWPRLMRLTKSQSCTICPLVRWKGFISAMVDSNLHHNSNFVQSVGITLLRSRHRTSLPLGITKGYSFSERWIPWGWLIFFRARARPAVPIHHYIDKTGYHIYSWSARRCRMLIGYAKLVKHQTGIFQIITLVYLQGTVHLKYVLEFRDYWS